MKRIIFSLIFLLLSLLTYSQGSVNMLDYNGSSSYVNCGTVNMSGNAITLQGWVKIDAVKSSFPYISSLWGTETAGSSECMVRLGDASLDADKVQFILRIGGSSAKLDGTKKLALNTWYHIAATYDGSTMKIYVNGILDASKSQTGSITSNSTFQIGQNYGAARTLDGKMEEVSVFKSALTQTTIRDWMCQKIKSSHPNYNTLEAYWKFDKGSGTSVTDHSANSHTGSLVSSPTWVTSSVPLGDTSIADYSTPLNLSLPHPDGDSMVLSSISGAPSSVHLYRVDQKPNNTSFPSTVGAYDSTRYWGVYFSEGSSPSGKIEYYYSNNSNYLLNKSCMVDLVKREDNSKTNWSNVGATQSGTSLSKTGSTRNEYVLTYRSNKFIHKNASETICDGDSVKLEHNTTGLNYAWYTNNVLIPGAVTNVYFAKTMGVYQLVTTLGSCSDTSNTFSLTTVTKPQVSLAPFSPSCPNILFDTLKDGLPAGGSFSGNFVSGNLFVVRTAGPGLHNITYTYTDTAGCSNSITQIKEVHNWPAIALSKINNMCADSMSFTLTNGTPTGGNYYINGTANNQFDAGSLGVGKHQIKYTITDTNNCPNADSIDVEIIALPNVVLNLITDNACENIASVPLDGQNPTGGLYTGTGVNGFNFEPVKAGVGKHPVTYTITDSKTGCSNRAIDTFTVKPIPAIPVVTQVLDSLQSTPADVYLWYDSKDKRQTGAKQSFKPNEEGDYYVIVRIDGCQSEKSELVKYLISSVNYRSNNIELVAYPIPANNFLILESKNSVSFKILDLNGKELYKGTFVDKAKIPVSTFDSGTYILQLKIENQIEYRKFMIQH